MNVMEPMKKAQASAKNHMPLFLLSCLALLFAGHPAMALDANDLSFYAPFDDSLNAAFAAGNAKPETMIGQYEFAPGVLGKAVITGEQGKELAYGVDNNFPDRKGTLAVWVKLVDWGTSIQHHLIISIPERLLLHHAANSGGIHLMWPGIGGNTYSYPPALNKEKFVHLVYTWGDGKVTLYGNGQYVRDVGMNQPPYFPASFKELPQWTKGLRFYLSNPAMTGDGKNKTILDELMFFNRPLDAAEVKSLYRHMTVPIQAPTLRIGAAEKPPVIDGNVQTSEWNQAAQVADFADNAAPFCRQPRDRR